MNKKRYLTLIFDESNNNTPENSDNSPSESNGTENSEEKEPEKPGKPEAKKGKFYTDEELNKLIDDKFAKWQKKKDAEITEAKKLAQMTAEEKIAFERDKIKAELEALKAANNRAEMEKTARSILQEDDVNVSDVIISHLVADDAETTSSNVKEFSKAFKAAVQKEVKAQLSGKSPRAGNSKTRYTEEEIRKETNPFKRQEMYRVNMGIKK